MNFIQSNRKKIAIFAILIVLLGTLFVINSIVQKKLATNFIQKNSVISPTPTIASPEEKNPSYKKDVFIPTYSPEKGKGVDLETPLVANSIKEIQKLYPFLPYTEIINVNTEQEVDIVIPDKTSQTNLWTLHVNISGLDYYAVKGDQNYTSMKNAFINATSSVYKWIQEKGADPSKIMFIWGDEEYIQNKSQEWLE